MRFAPSRIVPVVATTACIALATGPVTAQALQVGHEVMREAASPHPYPTGTGKDPAWKAVIEHPGATYLAVHFDRFELGPGDRVVVRSEDGKQRHVFTGRGKGDLGAFWATHVRGDGLVVELFSPAPHDGSWGLSIDRYAAGDADLQSMLGTEAICSPDDKENAVCYQTSEPDIYDHSRAVARLLIEGTLLCTGWLVGCEGHLLTNNHCIDDSRLSDPATAAANTDYEFLAEGPTCGVTCSGCGGAIWAGGATLVKRSAPLDYAFIQLTGNPQVPYGSFLLDDRTAAIDERIYIPQHAGGRAKEIGVVSSDASDVSGFCEVFSTDEPACTGGPGDVGYFCDTEGGSSGSPVVAYTDHRVVALHHCADCPNRGVPITAVIADLGGLLPACALFPGPQLVVDGLTLDDAAGNGDGVADPGEPMDIAVDLRNVGADAATGISGTLSTSAPMVAVTDDAADWPDIPSGSVATSQEPAFAVALGPEIPCGVLIDFQLDVTSDQGPFSESFQLQVGSNAATSLVRGSTDTPLAIPDNSRNGVTSSLQVTEALSIWNLNVSVDISHTWIGDLEVDLQSPTGTTVRLHDRTGGSIQNLVTTYDLLTAPDGPGTMDDFDGESLAGTWQLHVADRARQDVGTLRSWSLAAEEAPQYVCNPVCTSCTPPEVSPADSPVPFRMGVDPAGAMEFEQLPDAGLAYHLYGASTIGAMLAGDWTHKVCDLELSSAGTWAPLDAVTVRWTPNDPAAIAEGLWVVVAELRAPPAEGPYGFGSDGTPRPADADGSGSAGNLGCP